MHAVRHPGMVCQAHRQYAAAGTSMNDPSAAAQFCATLRLLKSCQAATLCCCLQLRDGLNDKGFYSGSIAAMPRRDDAQPVACS
jgi:hypothetical protein